MRRSRQFRHEAADFLRSCGPFSKSTWAFLALVVLYTFPIWVTPLIPGMDTPNHIAIVETLSRKAIEPDWHVHFEDRISPASPYFTYYGLGLWLVRFMPAAEAHRVIMTAFVILMPLSFLYLVRGIRPGAKWVPFLGFLLIYSDSYFVGFTNFILTLPLLLLGAGVSIRLMKRPEGGELQVLSVALISVLLFLTHPISCALLPVLAAILGFPQLVSIRRLGWLLAAWLPAGGMLLVWSMSDASPSVGGLTYLPFDFTLEYLARTPFILVSGLPLWVAAGLGLLLMGTALLSMGRDLRHVVRLREVVSPLRTPLVGTLAFVLIYFLTPFQVGATIWLNLRLAVIVWVLLFVVLGEAMVRNRLGRIAVLGLCFLQLGSVAHAHYSFGQEVHSLLTVVETLEPQARVLPLALTTGSEVPTPFYRGDDRALFGSRFTYYLHFGSYYHLAKKGVSPWMTFHASLPHIPLGIRSPFYRSQFRIVDPFFPERLLPRLPDLAPHFDYILLRNESPAISEGMKRVFPLLYDLGDYEVYSTH